jgi:hypothetical protein
MSLCLSVHSHVDIAYMYHFCMILACGRAASQHVFAHSPWLSTPQTSTRICMQVLFHSHCSAGALGAHFRHSHRASWHELAVNASPKAPLGAPWRALARTPSALWAPKTLAEHAAMRGHVERRARTHFGACGTRVSASPRHQKQREIHRQTRFATTLRVLRIFQKFRAQQTPRVLRMSIEPKNVRQQWRIHFVSCFVRGLLLHVFNKFKK